MSLLHLKQDYRFYQKAKKILSGVNNESSLKHAAAYLSCLSADFRPDEEGIPSQTLTQIALLDQKAALAILENHHFSGQLTKLQLTMIANSSLKLAMYILYDKQFLKKFSQPHFVGGLKEARLYFINALAETRLEYGLLCR